MKKLTAVILTISMLVWGMLSVNASVFDCSGSTEEYCPLSAVITPEKESFEKGETIDLDVFVSNTSDDAVTGVTVWVDYSKSDTLLTPGDTEATFSIIAPFATEKADIYFSEYPSVVKFASLFEKHGGIYSLLQRLAYFYQSATLGWTLFTSPFKDFAFVDFSAKEATLSTVTVNYDGQEIICTVKCRYSYVEKSETTVTMLSEDALLVSSEIKAVDGEYTGIAFGGIRGVDFTGFELLINPATGYSYLISSTEGRCCLIGKKQVELSSGEYYKLEGAAVDGRVIGRMYPTHENDEYITLFDVAYATTGLSGGGVVTVDEDGYRNYSATDFSSITTGKIYTNPVYDNSPDPYVLYENGVYYLYSTTNSDCGFQVSYSTDLINWQNNGFCARKPDVFGEWSFWAPEVYKYCGKYYMLYSTEEHLALAVADSPLGPFRKTTDGYLFPDHAIDGHIFFDDDGSIYLFMAYWDENGEEIYGCELSDDLLSIKDGTLTKLIDRASDEQGVNEGPFVLKHNGIYYLTYSANSYVDKGYRVDYATASSPLGVYTKQGTLLEQAGGIVGTGHHSFTVSPEGKELIIAYHCHYSATQLHARRLCIDRAFFIPSEAGIDRLMTNGPTSSSQPYPSAE